MFLAMGVGAFARRHLPPLHARVLQGAAVPRVGRGHPRAGRRAGPAAHGRPAGRTCRSPTGRSSIGALAIAGVPVLAGFFSKDEILFRTFASGHTLLWVVGLLTSLLTAIYMFRLVFLAFHGARAPCRRPRTSGADAHGARRHARAEHAAHARRICTTRRRAMALALDRAGRRLGRRRLRRRARGARRLEPLERFLEPSFTAPARAELRRGAGGGGRRQHEALELTLMAGVDRWSRWPASASRSTSS